MIFTLIFGGVALYMSLPEFLITLKSPVDLSEVPGSEIRSGLHVEGDFYMIYDTFAYEETWTENSDGSRTPAKTSKYYYLVSAGTEDDGIFIGLEAKAADRSQYEDLCDATWAYLVGEADTIENPVHLEGYVAKMDDELYEYFVDWFIDNELETDREAVPSYAPALMVKPRSPGLYPILLIGLAMIALNILFVVLFLQRRKRDKAAAERVAAANAAAAPSTAEPWHASDTSAPASSRSSVSGDPWDAPDKK